MNHEHTLPDTPPHVRSPMTACPVALSLVCDCHALRIVSDVTVHPSDPVLAVAEPCTAASGPALASAPTPPRRTAGPLAAPDLVMRSPTPLFCLQVCQNAHALVRPRPAPPASSAPRQVHVHAAPPASSWPALTRPSRSSPTPSRAPRGLSPLPLLNS